MSANLCPENLPGCALKSLPGALGSVPGGLKSLPGALEIDALSAGRSSQQQTRRHFLTVFLGRTPLKEPGSQLDLISTQLLFQKYKKNTL